MQLQLDIPLRTIFNKEKPEISEELRFLIEQGKKEAKK